MRPFSKQMADYSKPGLIGSLYPIKQRNHQFDVKFWLIVARSSLLRAGHEHGIEELSRPHFEEIGCVGFRAHPIFYPHQEPSEFWRLLESQWHVSIGTVIGWTKLPVIALRCAFDTL